MAITSRVTKLISSPMTKRNPRPRKYASQAERQAAYRARNVMLEFRAEPKTADNITKISDTLGYPRSDVLLSMVKFALTNHDWARFGLTHKTIPTYKENPMQSWMIVNKQTGEAVLETYNKDILSKLNTEKYEAIPALKYLVALNKKIKENPTMKPASPAQLAARKRFAEMARSGAFKKATKRKSNPAIPMANSDFAMITEIKLFAENDYDLYRQQGKPIIDNLAKKMAKGQFDPAKAVKLYGYLADSAVKKYSVEQMGKRTPTLTILNKNDRELLAQQLFEAYAEEIADTAKQYAPKRKTNPAKKTVSQKVSQLVHEGYPQRQAVAVALSEQRAGKVKYDPTAVNKAISTSRQKIGKTEGRTIHRLLMGRSGNPAKVKYRNLATDLKGDQRVGYSVHLPSQPGHNAIAWFSKKADAVKVAQEAADRTGKDLAVSRVQNYFGAM